MGPRSNHSGVESLPKASPLRYLCLSSTDPFLSPPPFFSLFHLFFSLNLSYPFVSSLLVLLKNTMTKNATSFIELLSPSRFFRLKMTRISKKFVPSSIFLLYPFLSFVASFLENDKIEKYIKSIFRRIISSFLFFLFFSNDLSSLHFFRFFTYHKSVTIEIINCIVCLSTNYFTVSPISFFQSKSRIFQEICSKDSFLLLSITGVINSIE